MIPNLGNKCCPETMFESPESGTIIPDVGKITSTSISEVLFTGVQKRVLGLLFGQPDRSFYANEIARLGLTGRGALQRELERMTTSGLITVTAIGRQKHYQASRNSPIFSELRSITLKTFGLADVLRQALSAHEAAIRCAFIYGSVAKGTDSASSDIDVMVIADGLGYSVLFEPLVKAEELLGRKVSLTLYSIADFQKKLHDDNHFITRVIDQPTIALIGDQHAFAQRQPVESSEDREAQV